jgi:hypothetical protein
MSEGNVVVTDRDRIMGTDTRFSRLYLRIEALRNTLREANKEHRDRTDKLMAEIAAREKELREEVYQTGQSTFSLGGER